MAQGEVDFKATQRFIAHSILDLIIPEASQFDIEEALSSASTNADEDAPTGLASIPQRKILYFGRALLQSIENHVLLIHRDRADEQLPALVVLRTPYQEEDGLKAYIERLSIAVEAHAVNGLGGEGRDGGPSNVTREVLWSGKVTTQEDPVIIVEETEDGEDEDQRDMFIIWRLTALLTRPRTRFQAPGILFKLSGSLEPSQLAKKEQVNDPYLRSGVPFTSQNIFQALEGDASLKGTIPYLTASRLSRIPSNGQDNRPSALSLKAVSRRAIRAYVALNAKFRYQKPRASHKDISGLASLDLEVPAYVQYALEIESVDISFASGRTTLITPPDVLAIPKCCQPRDNVIFLYSLSPDQLYSDQNFQQVSDSVRQIDLSITAKVLISLSCSPVILLRWRTSVDFSPTPAPSAIRPQSLARSQQNRSSIESDSASKASMDGQRLHTTSLGISATLPAIDNVRVGEPFHWDIFLVNRSGATRKLSVVVTSQSTPCVSTQRPSSRQKNGPDDAASVYIEEAALFNIGRTTHLGPTGLVCLTTDLNVEPLAPDACSTFSLTLLPLIPGKLDLAAIKFVDKDTGEALDLKDFPDIVVKGRLDEPSSTGRDDV